MTFRLPPEYDLSVETPAVADYQRLRAISGLTSFDKAAARAGLPGTFAGVVVRLGGIAVGMGRVVGDGGLFFQLVDIAVDPNHQGMGLGKAIVSALLKQLGQRIAARAYVSLVANGAASDLYTQFGFTPVAPKSQGMAQWLQPSSGSPS